MTTSTTSTTRLPDLRHIAHHTITPQQQNSEFLLSMNIYKTLILSVLLATGIDVQAQNANAIKQAVNEVIQSQGMTHASLSVNVHNITRNQTVYGYQPHQSLVPGSLCKIFTTAVGFDKLGAEFRFKTTLSHDGSIDKNGVLHGNLYIIGGGDPMLGSYRFRQTIPDTLFAAWHSAMVNKGIKSVDGRIFYCSNIFDNHPLHDSWQWGDIGNYYGAGAYGLNFHENMYFVYYNPGKKIGQPATVDHLAPKGINVKSYNEVTTGSDGSGDQVVIYGDPNTNIRRYCGTVPLGKNAFAVKGALPMPGKTCAELFSAYLHAHNINVTHNVSEIANVPDKAVPLLEYYSNTYYIIAQYTNQTSNNIYAESIFKYLGYDSYKKGTFANGTKAIYNFFQSHGLNTTGIKIVDGSGLSRLNIITADFVCRFLTSIHKLPIYRDFAGSMAKVKESGTAKNMLKDLPNNIDVRIKSGTMDRVKSYAGYVNTEDGEVLCFCIICNNHTCSDSEIKSKMEKIIKTIALYKKQK